MLLQWVLPSVRASFIDTTKNIFCSLHSTNVAGSALELCTALARVTHSLEQVLSASASTCVDSVGKGLLHRFNADINACE